MATASLNFLGSSVKLGAFYQSLTMPPHLLDGSFHRYSSLASSHAIRRPLLFLEQQRSSTTSILEENASKPYEEPACYHLHPPI
jgi:hypothetical protein